MTRSTRIPSPHVSRRAAVATAAALALGLSACAGEGDVPTEQAQEIENLSEELATFEERIGALEEDFAEVFQPQALLEEEAATEEAPVFADPSAHAGDEVSATGVVLDVFETTDAGAAFRLVGAVGEPVPVISTQSPEGLSPGDTVEVTGTVRPIDEPEFEQYYGIGLEELFGDPEVFLAVSEFEYGIAPTSLEVVNDTQ